ncbi:LytR C-terminal domain-containing protein [Patescibacteria group bacterium]
MQDLIVSLSENVLKVSTIENKEFKGVSADVNKEVVDDYKILDPKEFSVVLKELISAVTTKNPRSLSLNILVQPNDVIFKFVPVNKNGGDVEDQIINEIKTKAKELPLEEMHFSYQKIAPFVYQFIGVKKEIIDSYIEVSNTVGVGLKSIVPWVLLLPRFTDSNEPSIYLTKIAGKQIVALSEFNGIFFSGIYEEEKSTQELQTLVQELSIYKRNDPITKVFIYDYENFSLNPEYEILNLEIPNSDLEEAKGYEMHLLYGFMVAKDRDVLVTQVNLLNLLPVPVVQKESNKSLVLVGAAVMVLVVGGLIGGAMLLNKGRGPKVLENTAQQNEVLSENNDEVVEEVVKEKVELKKEDISIRIENGAGVPGIAGRTQIFLEGLGYQISDIDNADEIRGNTTLVKIKADKADYKDLLKEDMKDDFSVEIEEDLDSGLEYDVLIVIGADAQI